MFVLSVKFTAFCSFWFSIDFVVYFNLIFSLFAEFGNFQTSRFDSLDSFRWTLAPVSSIFISVQYFFVIIVAYS